MGAFTVIPQDTFNELQLDAGLLLSTFDPSDPSVQDEDIICATTGGITVSCVPTYSDFGADIDNCPNNTKELKHLDEWDCKMSTTAVAASEEVLQLSLGAFEKTTGANAVTKPVKDLAQEHFKNLWWVGDRADGGFAAVKLLNALSTGGYSLKTTKNGKGQFSIELTGHVSINAQNVMPMEFYIVEGSGA